MTSKKYLNESFVADASEEAKALIKAECPKAKAESSYPFELLNHGQSFYVPYDDSTHHSLRVNVGRRNSNRSGIKFALVRHVGWSEVVRIS